jgi:hypothetical protein
MALLLLVLSITLVLVIRDMLMTDYGRPDRGMLQQQVSKCKHAIGKVPFGKLRVPIVIFQIVSSFASITGALLRCYL